MLGLVVTGLIFAKAIILWNVWGLRTLVLFSFCLQATLTVFGNRRKYKAEDWFGFIVWLAYQAAVWATNFSLTVLSHGLKDYKKGCEDGYNLIMAFWAPFFLVHLCSPDTITAYSLEDNELWQRQLLSLLGQFGVAIYVFVMSWTNSLLNYLAIPMILVGLIKFLEKTWAQKTASSDQFRESMLPRPDPGPNYAKFMDDYSSKEAEGFKVETKPLIIETPTEGDHSHTAANNDVIPDASILRSAHHFFETFRRLFADLILSFQDRKQSQSFFQNTSWEAAFGVVEAELGFMYDLLHTKAVVIFSPWAFLHLISLILVISVFASFLIMYWHERSKTDVMISILLLAGAIVLEFYVVILLVSSDWTKLWLSKHKNLYKFVSFLRWCHLIPSNKRWSDSVAQYNLISFSLKDKPAMCAGIQKFFHIYEALEKRRYKNTEVVTRELKELIFELLLVRSESAFDISACKQLLACRGDWALEENDCFKKIGWSVEVEFDQSVLLWHLATDLCYYQDLNKNPNSVKRPECETSKLLSDYMLYLLVFRPSMLPNGIGQIRFQDTCAEAIEFLNERKYITDRNQACTKLLQVNTEIPPSKVKGDRSKSVLFDACRLAKTLQALEMERQWGSEGKWKMISHVWVEMLSYAASQCGWQSHAKQLAKGGELLTHVWLLMAHLGLSEQFQISEGHGRVKLLVS